MTFSFNNKVKMKYVYILCFLILFPLVHIYESDYAEFLKTYFLYVIFLLQLFILFNYTIRRVKFSYFKKMISLSQFVIILYSLFQYILFKYFGNDVFFNPWGSYQSYREYDYLLYSYDIRAVGFYLEPSVLGLLIIMLFWVRHILEGAFSRYNIIITIIGIVIANALSAYISFVVILIFWLFLKRKNVLSRYLMVPIVIIYSVTSFSNSSRSFEYLNEGSSTYWRFIAPSKILLELLPKNPLGLPFGSYEKNISSFGLIHGSSVGHSIDNGHLLYLYYFGGVYLIFLILLLYYFYKSSDYTIKSFIVFYLITANFSGAIFNIDYMFVILILPIMVLKMVKNKQYVY